MTKRLVWQNILGRNDLFPKMTSVRLVYSNEGIIENNNVIKICCSIDSCDELLKVTSFYMRVTADYYYLDWGGLVNFFAIRSKTFSARPVIIEPRISFQSGAFLTKKAQILLWKVPKNTPVFGAFWHFPGKIRKEISRFWPLFKNTRLYLNTYMHNY